MSLESVFDSVTFLLVCSKNVFSVFIYILKKVTSINATDSKPTNAL